MPNPGSRRRTRAVDPRDGADSTEAGQQLPESLPGPSPEPAEDRPPLSARMITGAVAAGATVALAVTMMLINPPYAVHSPGPTVDTTGDIDDEPLITVDGAESYPTDGTLLLTTVSTRGGPGYPVSTARVVAGWLSSDVTVVPREAAFDPEQTRDEVSEQSTMQMASSQTNASVAALTELGYEVPAELWVAGTTDDGAATGLLEPDDRLEWIEVSGECTTIDAFETLTGVLAQTAPGSEISLGVERDGDEQRVELVTDDDGSGGSVIGVLLTPRAELPIDLEFAIENIGGPSGGLMLALGIVDLLTPGTLTGGEVVAGTGTITMDGQIGPIGGIAQKLVGARESGAEWFLAPASNCDEVVGRVPQGLDVVAVETLAEAVTAVEAIADDDAADLPGCAADAAGQPGS